MAMRLRTADSTTYIGPVPDKAAQSRSLAPAAFKRAITSVSSVARRPSGMGFPSPAHRGVRTAMRQIHVSGLKRSLSCIMVAPSSSQPDTHDAGLETYYQLGGNCI